MMNFGQHWRTPGVTVVRYAIVLPIRFVVEHLATEFPEWIDDAIVHPDPMCTLECALREADWPKPAAIFDGTNGDTALSDAVLEYFASELLWAWFGDGEVNEEPGYVINTVDQARLAEGTPSFTGEARLIGIPVRYQDAE